MAEYTDRLRVTGDSLIDALAATFDAEELPLIRRHADACTCGQGRGVIEILNAAERLPQSGDAIIRDPGEAADARPRIANNLDRKAT